MRKQQRGEQVQVPAPDGTVLTVELPARPVYVLPEALLVSLMALVMAVPTQGTAWQAVRVLTLWVWALAVIRGAFHRGLLTAQLEHMAVMAAVAGWHEDMERTRRADDADQ